MSAMDLARASGASYRQIDRWTTLGRLLPTSEPTPGTGMRRAYSAREVEVAKLLKALSDLGMLGNSDSRNPGGNRRLVAALVDEVRRDGLTGKVRWEWMTFYLGEVG